MALPASRYLFGRITWYGFLITLGVVAALTLAVREEKRAGLPKDTVIDLSLFMLPIGIIGARLYFVAFSWDSFAADPKRILYIWEGGLAIYGGVIAGVITAAIFCRIRKISLPTLCDVIAPGLALAQGIGRWGNYFNREAFGLAVVDPSLQFFPFAVQIPENGMLVWHMATFFYESVWDLLVCAFLLLFRRRAARKGDVFLWYVLLYGAGRLIVESFRTDSLYTGGQIRISQLLAAVAVIAVAVRFLAVRSRALSRFGRFLSILLFALLITCLPVIARNGALHAGDRLLIRTLRLVGFSLTGIVTAMLLYFHRNGASTPKTE